MESQIKAATPLRGLPIVCYDTEIKACIGEGTPPVTWNDHHRMGISVAVAFDYRTGDFHVFFDDNIGELVDLLHSAKMVVGFNQIGFDNKLLRATGLPLRPDSELVQYDILVESRLAVAGPTGNQFLKGLKLDDHLRGTFGESAMKTGHGELAPVLYQQKKWGPLTSYCIADVRRHCMVFENIWEKGWVRTVAHGLKHLADPRARLKL
jgi:DEAD/DEAH box helicase domain-containing protein